MDAPQISILRETKSPSPQQGTATANVGKFRVKLEKGQTTTIASVSGHGSEEEEEEDQLAEDDDGPVPVPDDMLTPDDTCSPSKRSGKKGKTVGVVPDRERPVYCIESCDA